MVNTKKIKEEILAGIYSRKKNIESSLLDKINKELDILENTEGLEGKNNLLVLYDIWKKYKKETGNKNNINSWTCFALGLTSKEPTGDFLPKRRAFARAGFPDIDVDFEDVRQEEIFEYLENKYGRENGGRIGTHQFLNFKSCITRIVKVLDLADAFYKGKDVFVTENAQKVTEILFPFPKKGLCKVKDEKGESHIIKTVQDAYDHCPDFKFYMDKYPSLKKYSKSIEKTFSAFGQHAAGFAISDIPIERIAPLRRATGNKFATQFTGTELEALGLIKFDILGLSTLTVIKLALELIKKHYDIDIDITNLPLNDEPSFKLYRSGKLGGIFQCEQWGMQRTMKDVGVDRFEDIMVVLALYRPGPMDSIPEYCSRKKGEKKIDYFHKTIEPYVKPYLERTYGILCYQEQIMQVCNSLAGFSVTEGYVMIKSIGKKKIDLMKKYETKFIEGSVEKNVPKDVAQQYWDKFIVPFAGYGFNMAHACCYAYISYISAYLKANYTEEFVCAMLQVETLKKSADKYEKIEFFEKEFQKTLDIKFLSRDINKCKVEYKIEKKKDLSIKCFQSEIRPSLLCKGMGVEAAKEIEKKQPYDDIRDFAAKTNSSFVDMRAVDALIDAGYFKTKKKKDIFLKEFAMAREDIKKSAQKGVNSDDIFS